MDNNIINSIDTIIEKSQSTFIFTNKLSKCNAIFQKIKNLVQNCSPEPIPCLNVYFSQLEELFTQLSNRVNDLNNEFQCISLLEANSISTISSEIDQNIQNIFAFIEKMYKKYFSIPSSDIYENIKQIDDLIKEKYANNQKLQKIRDEINELYEQMKIPFQKIMDKYDPSRKYRLNPDDYETNSESTIIDLNGTFEEKEGYLKKDGKKVTVTVIKKKENFKNLFHIFSMINSPYSEQFVGASSTDSSIEIVTQRKGKKLTSLIGQNNLFLTIVAFKIAKAMSHFHSLRIVHRELNINNIYIEGYNSGKPDEIIPIITNFSNSIYLKYSSFQGLPPFKPTTSFHAPELNNSHYYDEKVDIFSFGGIIYKLCTGEDPFKDDKLEGNNITNLIIDGVRPKFPKDFPNDVKNLIEKCWRQKAVDRCSFDEIVDIMSNNQIIFPSDQEESKSQVVKDFYSVNCIKSQKIIECSKLFDTFIDCTKNVFLFNCELARVQPILVEYKNLLRNEYLLKELGNKDEEKIDSLKQYLEALKPIKKYDYDQIDYSMLSFNILNDVNILGAYFYLSIRNNPVVPINSITLNLNSTMKNIHDLMKEIIPNSNITQYQPLVKDLHSDYISLGSFINQYFNRTDMTILESYNNKYLKTIQLQNDSNSSASFYKKMKKNLAAFKDFEVDRGDYYYDTSKSGDSSGMSSHVYPGDFVNDSEFHKRFAIKVLKDEFVTGVTNQIDLNREIRFLSKFRKEMDQLPYDRYIIKFIGYSISELKDNKVWIINEFIPDSLFDLNIDNTIDDYQRTKIAFEVAEGMEYLHSQRIIHRDIKSPNILVKDKETPRIIDFGFSRVNINNVSQSKICGTDLYMAPEVLENTRYGLPADVFSFGLVLYELYLKNLFSNKQKENLPFIKKCEPSLEKLIKSCCQKKPSDRPTFTEIIERMIADRTSFLSPDCNEFEKEKVERFYQEKEEMRSYYNL